ncbi:MAG: helix-turn-helix domain-containing protein [Archaeoglobaceae archaeon]|nr:ArsR family transcriptional regulator [Archaeoglobaceae archaeon]MDW7990172.1 helix-turn-helix domain-containing protein [Archaeoglobaceae archaeon]
MEIKCDDHLKCTLKCAFDISCFDMEVYITLLKKNPATVEEIAEILDKDKSTVYKSLQKLIEKSFVERDYRILRSGGYRYLYKPIPFEEFKKRMTKAIEIWAKSLLELIHSMEKLEKEKFEGLITLK